VNDWRLVLFATIGEKTGNDSYANFLSKVKDNSTFKEFIRNNKYLFVEVKSSGTSWKTSGICAKFKEFMDFATQGTVTISQQTMFLCQMCEQCGNARYVTEVSNITNYANAQAIIDHIKSKSWVWLD
jgi:hypothetical protein